MNVFNAMNVPPHVGTLVLMDFRSLFISSAIFIWAFLGIIELTNIKHNVRVMANIAASIIGLAMITFFIHSILTNFISITKHV